MGGLAFFLLIAGCFLCEKIVRGPGRVRATVWSLVAAGAWGLLLLLPPELRGQAVDQRDDPVQLGLVLLYVLVYTLGGAALLLPFAERSWARHMAWVAPVVLCLGGMVLSVTCGDLSGDRVRDLVFLNPIEMGEGVTREGVLAHRFRVHALVLGGLLVTALLVIVSFGGAGRRPQVMYSPTDINPSNTQPSTPRQPSA